jgi:hypothetical protein
MPTKGVFICLYGVWIDGLYWEYDRWYGTDTFSSRVRKHPALDSFYHEKMRVV